MSIQGSNTKAKGKVIQGTGSILANLDAKARRAFAKRANKADETKQEKQQQAKLNKELDEIHQHIVERDQLSHQKLSHKPLSYWLLTASLAEIWQHIIGDSHPESGEN